jgi:LacI family transcriptional regulator
MSVGRQRRKGFIDGLKSHGMESNRDLIITCDSREGVLANKDSILQLASQIDGIFAVNDNTAISVIQLLTSHGYKIPEDISVVGFGNDPIASLVSPRLTTVDQQGFTLGRQAVEVLIHRLERPSVAGSHQTRVIGVNLQVRESS